MYFSSYDFHTNLWKLGNWDLDPETMTKDSKICFPCCCSSSTQQNFIEFFPTYYVFTFQHPCTPFWLCTWNNHLLLTPSTLDFFHNLWAIFFGRKGGSQMAMPMCTKVLRTSCFSLCSLSGSFNSERSLDVWFFLAVGSGALEWHVLQHHH